MRKLCCILKLYDILVLTVGLEHVCARDFWIYLEADGVSDFEKNYLIDLNKRPRVREICVGT